MKGVAKLAVVAVVLLSLAYLALHGILRARDHAAQQQCRNSLKQLTLAVHGWHDSYKRLPRATADRCSELPVRLRFSWLYDVDPYLQARMDPKFVIDPKFAWDSPENEYVAGRRNPFVHCHANAADRSGEPSLLTHYVAIAGVGKDAASNRSGHASNGAFGYDRITRLSDITDGQENTLLACETATQNGRWAAPGFPTCRGLDPKGLKYLGLEGQFSSFHHYSDVPTNASFCDGSVRALSQSLSQNLMDAMATIAGNALPEPE